MLEKTVTPPRSTTSFTLNSASPRFNPACFASRVNATMHPSLFESTATGLPSRSGRNSRSQEA
ncbi:MAG: hypothetical protein LKE39_10935 [Sphaerochaeta sp.]|nr:hypothetical protein [Sphaerochaeta sp.]